MSDLERFALMIKESNNIVFFGGAGVSTESGIPDFRSVDGLYNQKYKFRPETILSSLLPEAPSPGSSLFLSGVRIAAPLPGPDRRAQREMAAGPS